MKKIATIICLFLCINAFAQNDTARTSFFKKFKLQDTSIHLERMLLVVNGTLYKGDFSDINRGDVKQFDVLKPPGAVSVYGSQASFGALLINIQATSKDSDNIVSERSLPSSKLPKPLIVVNGVIYKGDISAINPQDIESVKILKDKNAQSLYGKNGVNGVIIITMKRKAKIDTLKNN